MDSNLIDPAFWSRLQFAFTLTYHYLFPQLTMGLAWILVYWKWRALRSGDEKYQQAIGSNFLLAGLLATGGAAIFPVMLFSTLAPGNSLTAYAVASSPSALRLASLWWPAGFLLSVAYFVFISRRYKGKVSLKRNTEEIY